jgi:hypothetical protein
LVQVSIGREKEVTTEGAAPLTAVLLVLVLVVLMA